MPAQKRPKYSALPPLQHLEGEIIAPLAQNRQAVMTGRNDLLDESSKRPHKCCNDLAMLSSTKSKTSSPDCRLRAS
jgi:hypothetical protein